MNIQSLLNTQDRQITPCSSMPSMSTALSPTSIPASTSHPTMSSTSPTSRSPLSAPEPIILAPHLRGHRSPLSNSPPSYTPGHSPPLKRALSPDHHDQQRSRPSHSPTMPIPARASHSPYMGLEALVQAATQEQRRMEASERAASHSPVVDRPPAASVSRSPEGSHSSNTRSLIPLDVTPHPRSRSPPPPKKQRRSDSPPRRLSGPGVPMPPGEQDPHEWLLEHYASPPADSPDADATDPEPTPADDMEVDDELLSLVEPVLPPPPPMQQQPPMRYPFAAPPPVLRISKPLMPTVVTTIHSPTITFPGPSPLGPGPMPPPAHGGPSAPAAKAPAKSKAKKSAPAAAAAAAAPPPKPKPAAKSRAKPKPKPEAKAPSLAASALKKSSAAAAANASRSQTPADRPDAADAEKERERERERHEREEAEKAAAKALEEEQDDKLYCVCKTRYDEDRVMIACDRCDEWYHTHCVNMPDAEVDLVDQFICPVCVKNNPKLRLQTTYKKRCHRGPDACTKPARGELSKYCSDACGVAFMDARIATWASAGGERAVLWDRVKAAERREGVVVFADGANARTPPKSARERDAGRLGAQLGEVVREREKLKREMDVVVWRARLVDLAAARAERVEECAWDQRLCFGDEEYAEYGAEVLASYGEREGAEADADGMQVDADGGAAEEGEWWCAGKKKCARHAGWQKLRAAEVAFEKEMKEAGLAKLTTRERELRKRIEDLLEPQARAMPPAPLQPANGRPAANGARKGKKKRT